MYESKAFDRKIHCRKQAYTVQIKKYYRENKFTGKKKKLNLIRKEYFINRNLISNTINMIFLNL